MSKNNIYIPVSPLKKKNQKKKKKAWEAEDEIEDTQNEWWMTFISEWEKSELKI